MYVIIFPLTGFDWMDEFNLDVMHRLVLFSFQCHGTRSTPNPDL